MDAAAIELSGIQTQQHETRGSESRGADWYRAEDSEAARAQAAQKPNAYRHGAQATDAPLDANAFEEDDTQLAAIRELMVRAHARGVWLSLAEIAEATEFAEASISAQLRHLRKSDHGGYRVEKRQRGSTRTAAGLRDARRGPVIWEYRVLPPGAGRTGAEKADSSSCT